MPVLDFILNIAALLLWLNWRAAKFDPLRQSVPATLAGTIRRADPFRSRPWHFLLALAVLLFLRAWVYWQIGPLADWTPSLRLGVVAPPLRSDFFSRAFIYSVLSFGCVLALFYLWLLLFSLINGRRADSEPLQKFVLLQLGVVDRFWWPLKLILPFIVAGAFWVAINPFLVQSKIIPPCASLMHRFEQASTVGLGVYLWWQYLLYAVLLLYVLSSYVYLGKHPIWSFLTISGHNALRPLRWLPLRIGKFDFAPLIATALIFVLARFAENKLTWLYTRLPV